MCTLILAWQVFDGVPVVAAANRDEATDRPSRPPAILDHDPDVVAPRDEEAGGTWLGYNEHGVFVAVTNRRTDTDIDGERSRGLLVRDALAKPSASNALAHVAGELADREYAGFNLVIADREQAALLEWDGVLRTTRFDPGVHVVVNDGVDEAATKADRIRRTLDPDAEETVDAWLGRVKDALRDHDLDACVHGDGYGTRSSSIVTIDHGADATYVFADGPPCRTEYREIADGQI